MQMHAIIVEQSDCLVVVVAAAAAVDIVAPPFGCLCIEETRQLIVIVYAHRRVQYSPISERVINRNVTLYPLCLSVMHRSSESSTARLLAVFRQTRRRR